MGIAQASDNFSAHVQYGPLYVPGTARAMNSSQRKAFHQGCESVQEHDRHLYQRPKYMYAYVSTQHPCSVCVVCGVDVLCVVCSVCVVDVVCVVCGVFCVVC